MTQGPNLIYHEGHKLKLSFTFGEDIEQCEEHLSNPFYYHSFNRKAMSCSISIYASVSQIAL